jgi:hypothetical protein
MQLTLAIGHEELSKLFNELAPIRIHMTPTDEDRRWLELEAPERITVVPDLGVRIVTRGHLRYAVGKLKIPATIQRLQLLLTPKVVQADDFAHRLAFELTIEEGDLAHVPDLLDAAFVAVVNEALTPRATGMVWNFGEALSKSAVLPERLEPLDRFGVEVTGGSVAVSADRVSFTVDLAAGITRTKPRPDDAAA